MRSRVKAIALFAIILYCIFATSAYALERPITPNLEDANRAKNLMEQLCFEPAVINDDGDRVSVKIKTIDTPTLNAPGKWEISISGGTGPYDVSIWLLEAETFDTNGYKRETVSGNTLSFSYECVVPGEYALLANVDTADNDYDSDIVYFDIIDSTGKAPTVEKTVKAVVQSCLNAGCSTDYDKALWLHDYLTNNAHYDITYSYYSADGVLLRGTGVCDSYRKAYQLLLDAVGIQNKPVTGGNHAWVVAYIEDGWYHIDPTWDDPLCYSPEDDPNLSGYEDHLYFGLTDAIMHTDHTFSDQGANVLSHNYAVHEGIVAACDGYAPCKEATEQSLSDLTHLNRISIENIDDMLLGDQYVCYTRTETGWEWEMVRGPAYLFAHVLSQETFTLGTAQVQYTVNYSPETKEWRASTRKITDTNTQVLTMPDSCTTIEEEAFMASPAKAINLHQVKTVGSRSFADCPQLTQIYVSAETTAIADDAFEGCKALRYVFCKEGSYGQQFALKFGLVPVFIPAE